MLGVRLSSGRLMVAESLSRHVLRLRIFLEMKPGRVAAIDVTEISDSSDQINVQVCYNPNQYNVQYPDEEQEVTKPSGKEPYNCTSKEEMKNRLIRISWKRPPRLTQDVMCMSLKVIRMFFSFFRVQEMVQSKAYTRDKTRKQLSVAFIYKY